MTDAPRVASAFVRLLPAVWWATGAIARWFCVGWQSDIPHLERFYALYLPGMVAARWLFKSPGGWYGEAAAVTLQDAAIAVVSSLVLATLAVRWRSWRDQAHWRRAVVFASLALPWLGAASDFAGRNDFGGPAALALLAGYFVAILAAILGPLSVDMRSALFCVALVCAATLVVWRLGPLEPVRWLYAGNLLSSLLLLGLVTVKSTRAQSAVA